MNMAAKSGDFHGHVCIQARCGSASTFDLSLQGIVNIHYSKVRDQVPCEQWTHHTCFSLFFFHPPMFLQVSKWLSILGVSTGKSWLLLREAKEASGAAGWGFS